MAICRVRAVMQHFGKNFQPLDDTVRQTSLELKLLKKKNIRYSYEMEVIFIYLHGLIIIKQ